MNMTIARIGSSETIKFASDELVRLLRTMDRSLFIDSRVYREKDASRNDILWVGVDGSCTEDKLDDTVYIDVKNGAGVISGSNPRSVLIAVYRFMYELGCRYLHPGKDGEKIPAKKLSDADVTVTVNEKASYRHRGVCIEGSNSYEHINNMIDWLPKLGLNGYFMQFQTPTSFFSRYYNEGTRYRPTKKVTDEDVEHIWNRLEEEIVLRGLDYHAVGHGWTCEPFGIHATDWVKYTGELPKDVVQCFAEVNGVRGLWNGKPMVTNLCYSNPYVRDKMTDAVVEYCKSHPAVNYLHFWLGDGLNNQCECAECKKMLPADYYVKMLNELDEKLTAAGLDTKIVCLVYLDLLWAPEVEKVKNQDRFVLMFAPITRTYTKCFTDFDSNENAEIAPYVRNKIVMPKSVAQNIAHLKKWQTEQINGDSFDFDYHLMWDHYLDPGYYECARILHTDMANLDKIGLNGMVSCQVQRVSFPTGLPMYAMAKALFNKNSVFEDVADEYYTAAFGECGENVKEYMKALSRLLCPAYLRGEKPITKDEMIAGVHEAKRVVDAFDADYIKPNTDKSFDWMILDYHSDFVRMYADVLLAGLLGEVETKEKLWDGLMDYLWRTEPVLNEHLDVRLFRAINGAFIKNIIDTSSESSEPQLYS